MAVPDKDSLLEFPQVSHSNLIEMVKLCPTKSCSLDPIPTSVLKTAIDVLAVPIASLYNLSVSTGVFPSKLKIGLITTAIKKPILCPRLFNNFRPITNVAFCSKCIEILASFTLVHHLSSNNLFVPVQSAYWANHSTETALNSSCLQRSSPGCQCWRRCSAGASGLKCSIRQHLELGAWRWNGCGPISLAGIKKFLLMGLPPRSSHYCLVWCKDQCWDQLCSFFTLFTLYTFSLRVLLALIATSFLTTRNSTRYFALFVDYFLAVFLNKKSALLWLTAMRLFNNGRLSTR